eukprot:m.89869 g.89869  ORF g.89869 m.89869 type:complete len:50 (-) comp9826_c0_seq1:144-293(-)
MESNPCGTVHHSTMSSSLSIWQCWIASPTKLPLEEGPCFDMDTFALSSC